MRSCCRVFSERAHFGDLAGDGGGSHGGADAYLLSQQLDGSSASVEALQYLGTLAFVALYLFSVVGRHSSVVAELFHLIERLEG